MFVESYGRVAVQDSSFSPRIDAVLERGTAQLRAAGFSSRSAFLTSPTFGGLSWLAHSTLQSGVTVDGQRRYDQLVKKQPRSRSPGRSSAPGGGRSASCRRTTARGRRARASTTTTRSTTAATSATAARTSACRRCPTSTRCWPCNAASSPSVTGRRCSPRSTSSRATRRGRASRGSSPGTTSATARSSTASRRRSPRRRRSSATPSGPAAAYGHSIEYSLRTHLLVRAALRRRQPRARRAGRPSARDARHRPGRPEPRRADLGHRPRPEGDGPDRRMELAGRHAAEPAGAGLAHGRVPRPLPHRVRPVASGREAGRPRGVRPGAAPRARVGVRARRVRRAGELHDRRRDPRRWRRRPASAPGSRCWTCAAASRGPGRFLTRELGCAYLGVDASASAVAIARERADGLPCRFAIAQVPPLPAGSFDVVLLLETMLAFEDKDALVREIAAALRPGGRFAFTLEEGAPLTTAERAAMPDADTVWLTPLDELARVPGAGRARRHVAGGPQPRAPRDGAGAGGRVRRGRREHRRADRPPRRWTTCSPPTGSGSSGWTRGGSGSSRWWRSGPSALTS